MTTVDEWSTEFDILYNNITSNKAPGLTEYEKSVFLTRAQEDVVRSHFSRSQIDAGIDSSIERQEDFRSLIVSATATPSGTPTIDPRAKVFAYPSRMMFPINEQVFCHTGSMYGDVESILEVRPLSFSEYNRLMAKPYKYPTKGLAWKLLKNSASGNVNAEVKAEIVGKFSSNYIELSFWYVQRPYPIILNVGATSPYNIPDDMASIDGERAPSPSKLPEHLHPEILAKAVDLAKAVWESRTGNTNQ